MTVVFNNLALLLLCGNFLFAFTPQNCPNQGPDPSTFRGDDTPKDPCVEPTLADVQFLLYTRTNKQNAIVLNPSDPLRQINLSKPIVVASHGWAASAFFYGMQPLKDAYLNRYDYNMILVNWPSIAEEYYTISVCELSGIGRMLGQMLCTLENNSREQVIHRSHLIGHSLGAHLVGFAGKSTKSICGKTVGRITGLDPAGTAFQNLTAAQHLNRNDAAFVDVIHTNMGSNGYGFYGDLGDVDFYVNCGEVQPGCLNSGNDTVTNVCSHFRVIDLMIESVNSGSFVGIRCRRCPFECVWNENDGDRALMGENCAATSSRGAYYVKTSECPPYALL